MKQEITFDRFIRGLMWIGGAFILCYGLNFLSSVLLPFFVAWIIAYLIFPFVKFLQNKCRLRNRAVSTLVALLTILGALVLLLVLVVPPTIAEFFKLKDVAVTYFSTLNLNDTITDTFNIIADKYLNDMHWVNILENQSVLDGIQTVITHLWGMIEVTVDFAKGIFTIFLIILYTIFILLDYETLSDGWTNYIPKDRQTICKTILYDVQNGMNSYFRGQALVALFVGILFSIGFLIIDFPLSIGLGMFIGLLNLVPYLQTLGFIPTFVLALIESAERGESFWPIFLSACAVFAIVQIIQDLILTPRIMGKAMGLNPAIILLSLSIWGAILGFIGLIIALPLTTLLISYYKQFLKSDTNSNNG